MIGFHDINNQWVLRITADRRIEVNEDVEVTEAAQAVLDALQIRLQPPAQMPPAGYALVHESVLRAWGKLDEVKEACCYPAQRPPNCGTGYCSCIECLFEQPAPAQELEADALIRKYINALVANTPDEAASATKSMVDYVYGITKGGA